MAKTKAKTYAELQSMRRAGRIVGAILYRLAAETQPGQTPNTLNHLAETLTKTWGGLPAFKGYGDYPATVCISVNDAVVHGIPTNRPFADGDIVGIDAGAIVDDLYADAAITVAVGRIAPAAEHLLRVTERALHVGIQQLLPGNQIGDAQFAMQQAIEAEGLGIIRDLTGHGIGSELHEEPHIPNFGRPKTGLRLVPGLTLCLEPMVTAGKPDVVVDSDGWTIRTKDHSLGAHFEHTIAVTESGPEILTLVRPW